MASPKVYPMAIVLPILSLLSLFIGVTPLVLHSKNRNYPMACLIGWFCLLNLFNVINAFIWPNDDIENWWNGVGLCDVEVKLMTASYVGVPGTLVPIFRNLAHVLNTNRATIIPSKQQRWRSRFMVALFCVVVPVIAMFTNLIYQRRRFFLFSISGCVNSYDQSFMSLVLAYMWPLIISLISGWYCTLVLIRLHKYRSEFGDILASASSRMTKSRFLRLFFLAFVMLLAIIPIQSFIVYYNVNLSGSWHEYSWAATHGKEWGMITKVPSHGEVFYDRWVPIVGNVMVFIFFGCGRDASTLYRSFLISLGFVHCFPRLARTTSATVSSSFSIRTPSVGESLSSRARLLFHRRPSSNQPRGADDCEQGLKGPDNLRRPSRSWFRFPWFRLGQSSRSNRVGMSSLPPISVPQNTISTTAWASSSRSRPSRELTATQPSHESPPQQVQQFIHVKQVISQQSETNPIS